MTAQTPRTLAACAALLAASAWAAPSARGDAIAATDATTMYSTVGTVETPAGGSPGLVYYDGNNNAALTGSSIDLGRIKVSALSATTNATYTNDPFHIIVSVGGSASEKIDGVLNGALGPNSGTPTLTATVTGISQYGQSPLPFTLSVPMNTPLPLSLSDGTSPGTTGLVGAAIAPAPVPEPSGVAVFALGLGGAGLWARRRARSTR